MPNLFHVGKESSLAQQLRTALSKLTGKLFWSVRELWLWKDVMNPFLDEIKDGIIIIPMSVVVHQTNMTGMQNRTSKPGNAFLFVHATVENVFRALLYVNNTTSTSPLI